MHHRNGSWVTGHYRSGTEVEDHQSTTIHDNSRNNILKSDKYGSITFQTECWWCGDYVFFHRDANGGCVLFDSLGAPWKVHECWLLNKHEHTRVIEHVIDIYEQSIVKIQKNLKYIESPDEGNELTFDGYLISYRADRKIVSKEHTFVELLIGDFFGSYYKVLVPRQYQRKLKWISMVSVTARWAYRGKKNVLFVTRFSACGPKDEPYAREFDIDIEKIISEKWIARRLKR